MTMQKSDFSGSPDKWTKDYEALQNDARRRQDFLIGLADFARVKTCYSNVQSWLNATAYANTAQVKDDLQEVAADRSRSDNLSPMAAYQLGLQYYQTLYQKIHDNLDSDDLKSQMGDIETQTMKCFLGKAKYPVDIEKKVAVQSRVMNAVAHVLSFGPNAVSDDWSDMAMEQRQKHLLDISNVTDHVMKEMDIHPQLRAPELIQNVSPDHINVIRPLIKDVVGLYIKDADMIFVVNQKSYAGMVGVLKHEKTHQLLHKEAIAELDSEKECTLMDLSTFHAYAMEMFKHAGDEKKYATIYNAEPQECMAHDVQKFPLLPYMTLEDRQDEYAFLEDRLGTLPESLSFMNDAMKECKKDITEQEHRALHEVRRCSFRGNNEFGYLLP